MKIECLVTDVMPVRSPDRAERAILGMFWLGIFWSIQAIIVVSEGSHFVMQEPPLEP